MTTAEQKIADRGPRWAVYGIVRPGEARVQYADTAEWAERIQAEFEDPNNYGYRNVRVYPPDGSIDLGELGRARAEAKRAYNEATELLRAGVLRAIEEGRNEAEIARTGLVDRMTVRKWAGK